MYKTKKFQDRNSGIIQPELFWAAVNIQHPHIILWEKSTILLIQNTTQIELNLVLDSNMLTFTLADLAPGSFRILSL